MQTLLHIIDTTGPGGAETVFIDLISHLPSDRYRSLVVIRGKGWVYEELCRRGIEPLLIEAKGSFNWRYLRTLMRLIRREKVDLIQSHLLGSNVYCALAGLLSRTPVVATFHGAVDVAQGERFTRLKFSAINRGASAIVAVSESLRENLIARTGLNPGKLRVIYNGIDTSAFQQSHADHWRQHFGWQAEDIIVGCLGNIRPAKAYDVLLEAAALNAQRSPAEGRFRYLVAGHQKKDLYQLLLASRDRLGLVEDVRFLGFCEDPADFLRNLDIFLLTSSSEGFSIATIQAMASGLPVIATRSGGPQEIISHGENGHLVSVQSPQEIAQALSRLVAEPEYARSIAAGGRVHAEKVFGIDTMVDAYRSIYREQIDDP